MLSELEIGIHHSFNEVKYLKTALTHSSYVNENLEAGEHNERLEFLGDAVLELCISEMLFTRFPEAREGELTSMRSRLVSQGTLAALARKLGVDTVLRLGKGEENQGGRQRDALLSDALEAVFGAAFLDGGFEAAQTTIITLFSSLLPAMEKQAGNKDHKSMLQVLSQKLFQERPLYHLVESSGPEHAKIFRVRLTMPDGQSFIGEGVSLKKAEQAVAALALAVFEQ